MEEVNVLPVRVIGLYACGGREGEEEGWFTDPWKVLESPSKGS